MNRPTKRPDGPYTIPEMIGMMRQHFVVDGAPKALLKKRDGSFLGCSYLSGCGCAIGCMITLADAEDWDDLEETAISGVRAERPSGFADYFNGLPTGFGTFLTRSQCLHDGNLKPEDPTTFRNRMRLGLDALEAEFCPKGTTP